MTTGLEYRFPRHFKRLERWALRLRHTRLHWLGRLLMLRALAGVCFRGTAGGIAWHRLGWRGAKMTINQHTWSRHA